jgi:CBS domain-containing protein
VHDAVALMVERDIGSLIVTEENEGIVGIVTERDVLTKLSPRTAHSAEKLVRDIMSSHIMCIHPSTAVIECVQQMAAPCYLDHISNCYTIFWTLNTTVRWRP